MFDEMKGQTVVLDTDSPFTYVGDLMEVGDALVCLADAAIYDAADARIPAEKYLIECAEHGYPRLRARLWVVRARIVAVSRLEDVVIPG